MARATILAGSVAGLVARQLEGMKEGGMSSLLMSMSVMIFVVSSTQMQCKAGPPC